MACRVTIYASHNELRWNLRLRVEAIDGQFVRGSDAACTQLLGESAARGAGTRVQFAPPRRSADGGGDDASAAAAQRAAPAPAPSAARPSAANERHNNTTSNSTNQGVADDSSVVGKPGSVERLCEMNDDSKCFGDPRTVTRRLWCAAIKKNKRARALFVTRQICRHLPLPQAHAAT